MGFKLEIETGNDGMRTLRHLAAKLREIALELDALSDGPKATIILTRKVRDVNGNSVGEWEYTA